MTKEIAIRNINKTLGLKSNPTNTNWSNINSNGIWAIEPNKDRRH